MTGTSFTRQLATGVAALFVAALLALSALSPVDHGGGGTGQAFLQGSAMLP